MNDAHYQDLSKRLEALECETRELKDFAIRNFLAGEIERIRFNGKAGLTSWLDDHGSNALSYAIYNPNEFRVFVGLAGAGASASGLIVPKQKLVVAPLTINGHVEVAADAEELGEKEATVLRVRFPSPQPFAAYALD